VKPKPKKPDTRPNHKKAPKKRKVRMVRMVDGTVLALHPSGGERPRGVAIQALGGGE